MPIDALLTLRQTAQRLQDTMRDDPDLRLAAYHPYKSAAPRVS